jgi:phosphohistidine phosphatase SixA
MADTRDTIQLHLLRHAHAGDPEGWTGSDAARPLSAKGEQQAERLARFLADVGFEPDAIITSPKVRAARTAEIVAKALDIDVREDERLARGFDLVTVEAILFDAGEPQKPVLVGHDPDFSDLLQELCATSNAPMRKSALARIDVERPLAAGDGTLRWLVPPDLLAGRKGR